MPVRTGLTKVGLPGAPEGMPAEDPTLATLLGQMGYMTAQMGKNHLGDRNEHFPTVHGFDEFFGNLYHLNAEEEPEHPDYPQDPAFREAFGPRGVFDCVATDADTQEPDPRFGAWGNQNCTDTGPLTRERMRTIDREVLAKSVDFMNRAVEADQPFFLWHNSTRMHIFTHLAPEAEGVTGHGIYADGMVEHDGQVGELLAEIDRLGIRDNTIIIYSTDNGAEVFTWPDGGTTMFRGEKNTQFEGGYRVPMMMSWPGVIEPGTIVNEIGSHMDMFSTLLAAAGDTTSQEQLLTGLTIGDTTFKSHIDGYNLVPALTGDAGGARDARSARFAGSGASRCPAKRQGGAGAGPACRARLPLRRGVRCIGRGETGETADVGGDDDDRGAAGRLCGRVDTSRHGRRGDPPARCAG
jgi:arylsulfatase A-like enzyme